MEDFEAKVNVTYHNQNGDLPDPVNYSASNEVILTQVTEALQTGYIPGIAIDATATVQDFVVDRFPASDIRPWNMLQVRPKTPFG